MSAIRNWTQFHRPFEPMETFTRSEPFPSDELKDTYVTKKRKKQRPTTKDAAFALMRQKE